MWRHLAVEGGDGYLVLLELDEVRERVAGGRRVGDVLEAQRLGGVAGRHEAQRVAAQRPVPRLRHRGPPLDEHGGGAVGARAGDDVAWRGARS